MLDKRPVILIVVARRCFSFLRYFFHYKMAGKF